MNLDTGGLQSVFCSVCSKGSNTDKYYWVCLPLFYTRLIIIPVPSYSHLFGQAADLLALGAQLLFGPGQLLLVGRALLRRCLQLNRQEWYWITDKSGTGSQTPRYL